VEEEEKLVVTIAMVMDVADAMEMVMQHVLLAVAMVGLI